MAENPESGIRLQKVLSHAGVASRRAAEEMITEGRVSVDGQVVTELGTRVDPRNAVIHVDGQRVPTAPDVRVLALNKPRGVVTTMSDERGRPCVGDLLTGISERVFHVGRLDADTEGLLLLTNDGELANRLAHPRHEVAKTYRSTVRGSMGKQALRRLTEGIELDDGPIACDSAKIIQQLPDRTMVELVLHSGRNRIVRRMLDAIDHPVIDLVRTQVGPIRLGQQSPGAVREVVGTELGSLYTSVEL